MGAFSDSPFFFLDTFFDAVENTEGIEKPILDWRWLVTFVSSFDNGDGTRTFSDDPYAITVSVSDTDIVFSNHRMVEWNRREYYNPNIKKTFNSTLMAPRVNISAKGGGIFDLFVKEQDLGYQPIKVRYQSREGNNFNFVNPGIGEYEPGENITGILNGKRYMFIKWDTKVHDNFGMFENNRETYFRKDSLYHEWLKVMAKDHFIDSMNMDFDIRKYTNTDKLFHYFHNVFKSHDNQSCRIIFDGMKDYVMRAVPEHQRTENFREFCSVYFDRLYQEIFDSLKNIWSMIDPIEIDNRYLGYLSKYYDMFDVDIRGASLIQVREFVRDMIWMIRRKGTYTEFYILWRILTATKNQLNIYERWHKRNVESIPYWPQEINSYDVGTWPNYPEYSDTNGTTVVPASAWVDVLYVNRDEYEPPVITGGAGEGWYSQWYPQSYSADPLPDENLMLSTHYVIETDISSEPLSDTEILTKDIWDSMVMYWEYIRPVNRVSNYRILLAPITDISGKYVQLYDVTSGSSAFLKTRSYVTFDLEDGSYIHRQFPAAREWRVMHNLGNDILIQVFDDQMNEIVPKEIRHGGSSSILVFDNAEDGFAIMRSANWAYTRQQPVMDETWRFYHLRQQKEILVHYRNTNDVLYSKGTTLSDISYADAEFSDREENTVMVGTGNFIYAQTTPSQIWDIPHYMRMKGVIMSVYTFDDTRVHPSQYKLLDSNNCKIEFNSPMSGYVVLRTVGDISIADFLVELDDLITSTSYNIYSYDDQGERVIIDSGGYVKTYKDDGFYYFDMTLDKDKTYTINEIELYDRLGEPLFKSMMSNLYKPYGVEMTFHFRLEIPTTS